MEEVKDMFNHLDELPKAVRAVLSRYEDKYTDGATYELNNLLLAELKPLGWTFEYGLDAVPYDLTKINE